LLCREALLARAARLQLRKGEIEVEDARLHRGDVLDLLADQGAQ
jgi:hypothetical protein